MGEQYLDRIRDADDLKKLPVEDLRFLSDELRAIILSVVSQNGGHLSSNLGVVELTVALEYVFDTRVDRLVWDVGHQCYAHKILTGRKEAFGSLRQSGGLSGFPKRAESPCDPYDTGHSSTSIAAALGFAKARDLLGESYKVIAVIGDGSMTGGQAFEAMNLAGELDNDILVVLNDNHMSIAPNIGGLSRYLTRLRASSTYTESKQAVRRFLGKIPVLGQWLIGAIEKIKDSLRFLMVNGVVFSELGFHYYGPVDGHDVEGLVEMLKRVKDIHGPVLLHVVTQKGHGYQPAVDNATVYHGIAPFDLETGEIDHVATATGDDGDGSDTGDAVPQTFTEAFADAMLEIAALDERVLAVTAAMADGTGLAPFAQRYPDRFFDTGIAEQTAVTFSTALALSGYRPVLAVYSSFLQRAFDQLIQDTALQRAPVLFALDRSGLVGEDGPTHHGAFDMSYLGLIPHMAVLLPRDEYMLGHMLRLAHGYDDGPVALRYPRGRGMGALAIERIEPRLGGPPAWGEGQLLREGSQALVIAGGPLVYEALEAAINLEEEGYSVAVYDPCFLKPLDRDGIWAYAKWRNLVLVVEENVAMGGLGSAVAGLLAECGYHGLIRTISIPDEFIPQGSQRELRHGLGLDAQGIAEAVRDALA